MTKQQDPASQTPGGAPAARPVTQYVTGIVKMTELISGTPADVAVQLTPNAGDVVKGTVVTVDKGSILVDLGSVCTGVISGQEVDDVTGTAKGLRPGDEVEALVLEAENEMGHVVLSLRRASQEKAWRVYQDAFEKGEPLEVTIGEANKGGLLMELDGIRGFIPVSQLTAEHYPRVSGADPDKILTRLAKLVGQKLRVKILTLDPLERRMILSEKAAYAKERDEILKTLSVGEILEGRVSGIVNFGVFVNYKGVEGLVHISEIAWGHVTDPTEAAQIGDPIQVKVIGIEGDKVSFSIKRLTPDPWIQAVSQFHEGQTVDGVVARFTPFGAFVRLTPEVDGLIHNSELLVEGKDASEQLSVDQKIQAKIISIDLEEHRIGLSLKQLSGDGAVAAPKKRAKKSSDDDLDGEIEALADKPKKKAKRVRIVEDDEELA